LRLPDAEGEGNLFKSGEEVEVVHAAQWGEHVSRVVELRTEGFRVPDGLRNERIERAYLVSLLTSRLH
jgi:hypothetical protein